MKQFALLIFTLLTLSSNLAAAELAEKPTMHMNLEDISSMEEAKKVFIDKTAEIRRYEALNLEEAAQIHIITYSLEKSVEYFALNLEGENQKQAEEIAVVVEDIHIASESNRLELLDKHLKEYFRLIDKFLFCF